MRNLQEQVKKSIIFQKFRTFIFKYIVIEKNFWNSRPKICVLVMICSLHPGMPEMEMLSIGRVHWRNWGGDDAYAERIVPVTPAFICILLYVSQQYLIVVEVPKAYNAKVELPLATTIIESTV